MISHLDLFYNTTVFTAVHEIIIDTLVQTFADPQICECVTTQGIPIYIRYNDGHLVCRNKNTNEILAEGEAYAYKTLVTLPLDQIMFYIEMHSRQKVQFIYRPVK